MCRLSYDTTRKPHTTILYHAVCCDVVWCHVVKQGVVWCDVKRREEKKEQQKQEEKEKRVKTEKWDKKRKFINRKGEERGGRID